MIAHMTTGRWIEVAAAAGLLALSVYLYRSRRNADQGYGSQGAVLPFDRVRQGGEVQAPGHQGTFGRHEVPHRSRTGIQ